MTQRTDSDLGTHFLDTGPFFCLGGSRTLADLYDEAYVADARVAEAVAVEVNRRATAQTRPGDPHRRGATDAAARSAARRYHALLESAIPRPDPTPSELSTIEADLLARAQQKWPDRTHHPLAHRGESESIHGAESVNINFVSCDDDARRVAHSRGVRAETFVDVARRLARAQNDVKPKRILGELHKLARSGIDIGDVVQSVLDLRIAR